jgi:phenylalanyl-tRNA synthetase beta chain
MITTLSDEVYTLPPGTLLITDALANTPIGIAGIKGGKAAEVTPETTDLVIEAAHFDGALIRRVAQELHLFTDASQRFQNRPHPLLVEYGMRDVLALITEVAGGEVVGVTDVSAAHTMAAPVSVSLVRINSLLGSSYTTTEVESAFTRLGLPCATQADTFTVIPPFERTDLTIPEDLIEEVGRIMGYDEIPARELPPLTETPDQARYRGIERMKDQLVEQGFIEVSTQSFAREGAVVLANPLDIEKPALRTSLEENLSEALAKAKYVAPLVLAPKQKPKLFEVGTVFPKEGEYLELRMTEQAWEGVPTHDNLSVAKLEDYGKDYEPKSYPLSAFAPFSVYPFITRDIAFWAPSGTDEVPTQSLIRTHAGELCTRVDLFDRFEKEGRTSLGYRLVFQSTERTLTDEEVNTLMEPVIEALIGQGFEVR